MDTGGHARTRHGEGGVELNGLDRLHRLHGERGEHPASIAVATREHHRGLAVVPLIRNQRYYGEAPVWLRRGYGVLPGRMGCPSAMGIECCESGAPNGAERFHIGHDQEHIGVHDGTSRHEPSERRNAATTKADFLFRPEAGRAPAPPTGHQASVVTSRLRWLKNVQSPIDILGDRHKMALNQ